MIPHIYTGNGTISILINGSMKPVDKAHQFYDEINTAIKAQNWDVIPGLVNISKNVDNALKKVSSNTDTYIKDGEVFYKGQRVDNTLTKRIITMIRDGFDVRHMIKFLENLMQNPSHRAVTGLYDFLESGQIPITENGTFLAYKRIRENWNDIYTNTISNAIGASPSMPRNMVNEDPDMTCSNGLHVCSYSYLKSYGSSGCGDRVVLCEVNPRDIVAIPRDYNFAKMRVSSYLVLSEVKDFESNDELAKKPVFSASDYNDEDEEDVDTEYVDDDDTDYGSDNDYESTTDDDDDENDFVITVTI